MHIALLVLFADYFYTFLYRYFRMTATIHWWGLKMGNEVSKHLVKLGVEDWSFRSSVIHFSLILLGLKKFWEHFLKNHVSNLSKVVRTDMEAPQVTSHLKKSRVSIVEYSMKYIMKYVMKIRSLRFSSWWGWMGPPPCLLEDWIDVWIAI